MSLLTDLVAQDTGLTKGQAKEAVKAVMSNIRKVAYLYGSVRVGDFGTFTINVVNEKSGVTKMSGEAKEWTVPEHYKFAYTEGTATTSYMNGIDYPNYLEKKGISYPFTDEDYLDDEDEETDAEEGEDSDDDTEADEEIEG